MSLKKAVKSHAKRVAIDMKVARPSTYTDRARDFMLDSPEAILDVIMLTCREANRNRPDGAMIQAYLYLFVNGLEAFRHEMQQGNDRFEQTLFAIRDFVLELANASVISRELLMLFLRGFVDAKLDPGGKLEELLNEVAADLADVDSIPNAEEIGAMLDMAVEQSGGDAFEVHRSFAEACGTYPDEGRALVLLEMTKSENPVLRDSIPLCLLDPSCDVRLALAKAVSGAMMSPVALRRLTAVQGWLPEAERRHLDAATKRARQDKVSTASWAAAKLTDIVATNIDGVGAQGLFATVQDSRKYSVACLMVKHGIGVADAWCVHKQSKADVKELLGGIQSRMDTVPVSVEFLNQLVPHVLAVGLKSGRVPAAGLLEFAETVGIGDWQPAAWAADDMIAAVERDAVSTRLDREAVEAALEMSEGWLDEFAFMDSWFEEDSEVAAILRKKRKSRTQTKVDAVIKSVLEPRRAKWAERFLWTGLWMREAQDLLCPWSDFFAIGRELHRGRPIAEIPVMVGIAESTVAVDAFNSENVAGDRQTGEYWDIDPEPLGEAADSPGLRISLSGLDVAAGALDGPIKSRGKPGAVIADPAAQTPLSKAR